MTETRTRYQHNPIIWAAQQAVAQAIEEGELTRPEVCELCGEVPDPIRVGNPKGTDFYRTSIFAHHWNGYDNPLDVWFICRACDGKLRGPENHNGSVSKEEARRLVTNGASDLIDVCRDLLNYRQRVGALGFQLVKLDDYLRRIEEILDAPRPRQGKEQER